LQLWLVNIELEPSFFFKEREAGWGRKEGSREKGGALDQVGSRLWPHFIAKISTGVLANIQRQQRPLAPPAYNTDAGFIISGYRWLRWRYNIDGIR